MSWLSFLFQGCFVGGCIGLNWRTALTLLFAAGVGFGGWSVGTRLDASWSTGFMEYVMAGVGAVLGVFLGLWLLGPPQETRTPED